MDNEIHPVRFTNKEVDFLKHMLSEFGDYHEEESWAAYETIKKATDEEAKIMAERAAAFEEEKERT